MLFNVPRPEPIVAGDAQGGVRLRDSAGRALSPRRATLDRSPERDDQNVALRGMRNLEMRTAARRRRAPNAKRADRPYRRPRQSNSLMDWSPMFKRNRSAPPAPRSMPFWPAELASDSAVDLLPSSRRPTCQKAEQSASRDWGIRLPFRVTAMAFTALAANAQCPNAIPTLVVAFLSASMVIFTITKNSRLYIVEISAYDNVLRLLPLRCCHILHNHAQDGQLRRYQVGVDRSFQWLSFTISGTDTSLITVSFLLSLRQYLASFLGPRCHSLPRMLSGPPRPRFVRVQVSLLKLTSSLPIQCLPSSLV